MLAALAERRPIEQPVALVVAHPDDETLAAGGSLHLFRRLLLVHVTDGAPRRLGDAAREGFATPAAYAAAREAELAAALAHSGALIERAFLGIADQQVADAVDTVADRLRRLVAERNIDTVMTHPYEGGHPDHDAVAASVARLDMDVVEFAGYHADDADFTAGTFLPLSRREREIAIPLPPADLARKRAMLACFHTQRDILSRFDPTVERFRSAPRYDFSQPPHPGPLLYERWGWCSFADWRSRCAA